MLLDEEIAIELEAQETKAPKFNSLPNIHE